MCLYDRCGSLVKLSGGRRTAERRRPLDEFNNGVVMTNRPLRDDELFEVGLSYCLYTGYLHPVTSQAFC